MNKLYKEEDIQAIGNAIRTKGGTSALLKVEDMAQAIADIPEPTGTQTVTENGTYNISDKKYVAVNVPQTGIEPQGTFPITQNGTYNIRQYENVAVEVEGGRIKVNPTYRDTIIIPDMYNTGCKGTLTKIIEPQVCGTISLTARGGGLALNVLYDNTNKTSGEHVAENFDFTNFDSITVLNPSDSSTERIFTFKNCKFNNFWAGGNDWFEPYLHFNFINCSFIDGQANARCCYYEKCQFNNNDGDGLTGYHDFTMKSCFIYTSATASSDGLHIDGIQVSQGNANNVVIDNCRFESLEYHGAHTSYINASIMYQIESTLPSDNVTIKDCILNGGGYSLYTWNKAGGLVTDFTLDNVKVGESNAYGHWYGSKSGITFLKQNVTDNSNLYVSTVEHNDNTISIVATNDTLTPKILNIRTNLGITSVSVPASYQRTNVPDDVTTLSDYPVDIVTEISAEGVDYVICYDGETQIRFVNYTGHDIYIGGANVEPITITQNGTYTPTEGVDGFNSVTVNVQSSGTPFEWETGEYVVDTDTNCLYDGTTDNRKTITHHMSHTPNVFWIGVVDDALGASHLSFISRTLPYISHSTGDVNPTVNTNCTVALCTNYSSSARTSNNVDCVEFGSNYIKFGYVAGGASPALMKAGSVYKWIALYIPWYEEVE